MVKYVSLVHVFVFLTISQHIALRKLIRRVPEIFSVSNQTGS